VVNLKNINGLNNEQNTHNNVDTTRIKTLSKADFPFGENFTTNPQWFHHTLNTNSSSWMLIKENNAEEVNELQESCYGLNNDDNDTSQQIHYLLLPYFNLNEISASAKSESMSFCLDFDYAYVLWEKWGKDLETTSDILHSTDFLNTTDDWKRVHQNLTMLLSEGEELLFRIKFVENSSRSIFIDNVSFNFCESIPLNIQNYLTEHEIGIFPNPSLNGQFQLYSGNPKNLPIHVQVFDASGISIFSFQFQKHYSLNLKPFPNGCYFVKMQFEGHILSKKLILSK